MPGKKSTFNSFKKKGWTVPSTKEHILGNLQGKRLGSHRLLLLVGPKNRFGATYFQVFLQNARGETSQQPIIMGLHNQGSYPSYNWIEIISLAPEAEFDSGEEISFSISSNGRTQQLFKYLADLLPSGGHMMVEYDSPEQRDTAQSLALGIPPIATPLGYTLFLAGCGIGFRDWYFAEGGSEGPRKLQGYKALDSRHAKMKTKEIVQELRDFLGWQPSRTMPQLVKAARERALAVLSTLSDRGSNHKVILL
jgi:hypothetical protein